MKYHLETCAGSLEDCIISEKAGATRIELNSAVHMGGLTPSLGLVTEVLETVNLPIVAMVRPRGGGFIYDEHDQKVMFNDAKILLQEGIHGIAFGFLDESLEVDEELTKKMVDLCHDYGAEAVFHRAFDRSIDMDRSMEVLIKTGVDRVLTSGQETNVEEGIGNLKYLQKKYGQRIEICAGSGVNSANILELVEEAGLSQIHGSFKTWGKDVSTDGDKVSYKYHSSGDYDKVSFEKVKEAASILDSIYIK